MLELLCEKYDDPTDKNATVCVTEGELCRKLRKPFPKKMKTFLKALQNLSLFNYEVSGKTFKFEIPILWELKQKDFKRARRDSDTTASNPPLREKRKEKREKREEKSIKKDSANWHWLLDLWNTTITKNPKVMSYTAKRKKLVEKSIRNGHDENYFQKLFQAVEQNIFLCGGNDRGWRAGFEFVMREESQAKILEGFYEFGKKSKAQITQDNTLGQENPYA